MITAIIIDDEAKGRLALRKKLQSYCPDVKILAEAADGNEALSVIEKHHPQLIFLDIEMPKMNGFEMLNAIKEKDFQIIFTTAYDQYAIKAIKYAAFDYLLKPVDIEELKSAIARIEVNKTTQTKKQIELLQHNIGHPKKQMNKLAVSTLNGLLFFEINDVIHLEAQSNYTNIFFKNKPKIMFLTDEEPLCCEDSRGKKFQNQ